MIECHDAPRSTESRRQEMLRPEEVEAMVGLYELGWGTKRIAAEFGCSRNTVKRYVATAGWAPYGSPRRPAKLDGLEDWLKEPTSRPCASSSTSTSRRSRAWTNARSRLVVAEDDGDAHDPTLKGSRDDAGRLTAIQRTRLPRD